LQERLLRANGQLGARLRALADSSELRADGDMELADADTAAFAIQGCEECGGVLKPAVTFFGGSVPQSAVEAAKAVVSEADALLVVGSSLQVFSAFRLARLASERGLPIALLNAGPTRADSLARLHVEADAAEVLPMLAERLPARARGREQGER